MLSMLKWIAFAICLLWMTEGVRSQPGGCQSDEHCSSGFYCYTSFCRECINCADYKRNAPAVSLSCIKSIAECGPCIKGLVEDIRGDVNAKCVTMDAYADAADNPSSEYVGLVVVGGLIGVIAIVVIGMVWALRNFNLKLQASTRASVRSPYVPSAPEMQPPPYEPRPSSPDVADPLYGDAHTPANNAGYYPREDSSFPFIRRDSKPIVPAGLQSDGSQAASWFSTPNYVRPPRYDSAAESPRAPSTPPEPAPTSPTHTDTSDSNDSNGNVISSSEPVFVTTNGSAGSSAVPAPVPARPFTTNWRPQDTNNNGNGGYGYPGEGAGAGSGGGGGGGRGQTLVINVLQNINAAQQLNDVKL